jgi:proline iminopeptidase
MPREPNPLPTLRSKPLDERAGQSLISRRTLFGAGVAAASLAALSPQAAHGDSPRPSARTQGDVLTGGARTVPISGGHHVWVKHVPAPGSGIPVLTLHGGPGFPHFYFECFEDFLPAAGISYWYYDQLGCGFSDQPKDAALWTIERFTQEVEEVRHALGLERMVLLGHSWGGLLGIEYALRHPERLTGLVISNMCASEPRYSAYLQKLRSELPAPKLRRLEELERSHAYDSPEYESIMWEDLYRRHICRLDPWPEPVLRAVKYLSAPVYNAIQGPSEFEVTGSMKGWDRWNDLSKIRTPTLVIGGRFDEMNPSDMQAMGRLLPDSTTAMCERGSHLSMYDDQQAYFAAVVPFLQRVTRL